MIAELLALGAALCYAINGMIAAEIRGRVTVVAFTALQLGSGALLAALIATLLSGWGSIRSWHLPLLLASGVLGPFVTSTMLTASIFAIGPRLAALLFTLNIPFSAILAYLFLGEALSLQQLAGLAIILAALCLAVAGSRGDRLAGRIGLAGRTLAFGMATGALSALGQSVGSIAARPVMAEMADPFAATAIRSGAAALLLVLIHLARGGVRFRLDPLVLTASLSKGVVGTVLAMTLLMAALSYGNVGVVATLSSLAPILILPMIWIRDRLVPSPLAWTGAILAATGCGLMTHAL